MANLANLMECPVMVFGSSKSRQINNRNSGECHKIMVQAFRDMAEGIEPLGVTLLIEPLGKNETDSINNCDQAIKIVNDVDHNNLLLHVDLKSSIYERENYERVWSAYGSRIKHCHVANPGLRLPSNSCKEHIGISKAIQKSQYNRYISIESSRKYIKTKESLIESIKFVQKLYLKDNCNGL